MGKLNTVLCGIGLDNPVIPASGTFGYGYEFAELYDINVLGTFSFKGTTREPRFGPFVVCRVQPMQAPKPQPILASKLYCPGALAALAMDRYMGSGPQA